MRRSAFCFTAVLLSLHLALSAEADPAAEVVQLNQKAMSDYQNMRIDAAVEKLQQAEGLCLQLGLQGHELALTYVNMGVIEAAGNQNQAAAVDFFTRALCAEPTILVDPLVSTPEVETVFNAAREQAADPSVCAQVAAGAIPPPPPGDDFPPPPGDFPPPGFDEPIPPPPDAGPIPSGPPPPQTDNIRHEPVFQQERMTPIPVFTLVKPGTPADKVVLNYRTFGERNYQQVEMQPMAGGYGATIGCDVLQTFDPSAIEYFIVILDETGQVIGSAGDEMQPQTVSFVSTPVSPQPSLPSAAPPEKCMAECPPWNPDCNAGGSCKQFGDLCDKSSDCCKGMICKDATCTPGDDEDDDGGTFKPIFKNILAFGSGAGFVSSEEVKPYNRVAEPPLEAWLRTNQQFCTDQGYSSTEYEQCFDDHSRGIIIGSGIAWAKLHFRETAMFYLTERLTLGASFRGGLALDPSPNVMKVAPLGLLMVGYRLVGSGTDLYDLGVTLGVGGGFILHKISYKDCNPWTVNEQHPWYPYDRDGVGCAISDIDRGLNEWTGDRIDPTTGEANFYNNTYFRKSGFVAIELGIEQNFWISKHVGLHLGILFDVMVPNLAINGDIQLGLALRL